MGSVGGTSSRHSSVCGLSVGSRSASTATTARSLSARPWIYGPTRTGFILDFSRRGKPTDNAAIESFNGRFREECLNIHWFASVEDATTKIEDWRQDYNANHPHRALKGLSPNEYARQRLLDAAESPS